MDAFENAKKRSREEVLEQIQRLHLPDYGISRRLLSDCLALAVKESLEEKREPGVAAALNNADTDGVLLSVLKADPGKIMEGISIVAYALGTDKKYLYLPQYAAELAGLQEVKAAAESYQIELVLGIVNKRERKGCACIHLVTAANLVDAMEGKDWEGVYVSVNSGELMKVPADTTIGTLTGTEGIKAILAGYRLWLPEARDLTVGEAGIDNGVLRVLKEKDCVVAETEKRLAASRKQSCGICVFCREGLLQLQQMQKEIKEGKGKMEFLDLTKEIGSAMESSALCTMGRVSAEIALSAAGQFEKEYEAHIRKKNCPAGVCFSAETVYINPKLCDGCGACIDVCPKDCIEGRKKYIHMIDPVDCDRCGACIGACPQEAVVKTSGKLPKLPDRLTKAGRFKK